MDIVTDRVKHFFLKINSSLARISAGRAVERERERDGLEENGGAQASNVIYMGAKKTIRGRGRQHRYA